MKDVSLQAQVLLLTGPGKGAGRGEERLSFQRPAQTQARKTPLLLAAPHPGGRWRQQRLEQSGLFCIFKKFTNSLAVMSAEARLLTRSPGNDSNMANPAVKPGSSCSQAISNPSPNRPYANILQVSKAYGINQGHPVKVMNLHWPSRVMGTSQPEAGWD